MAEAVGRYRSIIREERRKLLLIQKRRLLRFFNRPSPSFLPRIYGFMKGDSTAKTCDPSTVKRVSGQAEQRERELNSAVVIFSLGPREIESYNYVAGATSHFAARCAQNGSN